MLKKKYRMPAGIKIAHASSYKSQYMKIMIAKNDLTFSRFGFIASKKIDKRAVVRNRIKRVVRSCIEEMRTKITGGYDMLFIISRSATELRRARLYNEIETLLGSRYMIE